MKIGVTSRNDDDEDDDDDGVDSENFDEVIHTQRIILLKVDIHNYVYA